jgi:hypothetical protein
MRHEIQKLSADCSVDTANLWLFGGAFMLPFAKTDESKLETEIIVYNLYDDLLVILRFFFCKCCSKYDV